MKETYRDMEMEIIRFASEDVITTSCSDDLPVIPDDDD